MFGRVHSPAFKILLFKNTFSDIYLFPLNITVSDKRNPPLLFSKGSSFEECGKYSWPTCSILRTMTKIPLIF